MATLIGTQTSTDDKIFLLYSKTLGTLETTGKLLNNMYNNLDSANELTILGLSSAQGVEVKNPSVVDNYTLDLKEFPLYEDFQVENGGVKFPTTTNELLVYQNEFTTIYLFSKTDNKWYVSRSDDQEFKPLDEELAKL